MAFTHPSIIRNLPFFRDLPDAVIEELSRSCVPRTFGKQEMIYLRGRAEGKVFLLLTGEVKLYLASAGQRIVVQIFKPGDFFGDLAFVNHPSDLPPEDYAQATQDSKLCVMSTKDVTRLLGTHASFAMTVLVALRNRLHRAQSKIKDLAISSAPTRLLNELIRYALSHGQERDGFYEIEQRLTHQLLADMSGLARETVTKTLGDLEKQGFISHTAKRRLRLNKHKIITECAECISLMSRSSRSGIDLL